MITSRQRSTARRDQNWRRNGTNSCSVQKIDPFKAPNLLTEAIDSEVRVNQDELGEYAGDDSIIELTDKSGYYVTVSAFHGLHCIRRLHQYIYPETYYSDATDNELWFLRRHTGGKPTFKVCRRED